MLVSHKKEIDHIHKLEDDKLKLKREVKALKTEIDNLKSIIKKEKGKKKNGFAPLEEVKIDNERRGSVSVCPNDEALNSDPIWDVFKKQPEHIEADAIG